MHFSARAIVTVIRSAATWSGAVVAERRHSTVVARLDQPSSCNTEKQRSRKPVLSQNGFGVLLLLNGYIILKESLLIKGLTLANFVSLIFVGKMCFCGYTSNDNCHFSSENGETAKRVVDFPLEKRHIPKQNRGICRGF